MSNDEELGKSTSSTTRRNPLARLFADSYATGVVTGLSYATPTMLQIRIRSASMRKWRYTPGQHVRIQINDPLSLYGIFRPVETLRAYTIWNVSPADHEFELRGHLYDGDGIGREWLRQVAVDDEVTYWGPQGDFALREADFHLFVGEETASCGFGPLLRQLPSDADVYGVLESAILEDDPPMPSAHRLQRVHRNGESVVSSPVLLDAVEKLELPEPGRGVAYLAGEARTCQAIRAHLISERGWNAKNIVTKPFWTPGKRGLHH